MQEPLPLSAQLEPDGKTKLAVWSAYRVISEGRAISLTSTAYRPERPPGSTRCTDNDERQGKSKGVAGSCGLVSAEQACCNPSVLSSYAQAFWLLAELLSQASTRTAHPASG